jgi:hypothetical protein
MPTARSPSRRSRQCSTGSASAAPRRPPSLPESLPDAVTVLLAWGADLGRPEAARVLKEASIAEAAILDLLVKVLPEVVGAAAAPLSAVDKMTVISADGVVHVPVVSADGDGPPKA